MTLNPDKTKRKILEAALKLGRKIGIENLTLQKIAQEAKVSYFAVHYHFGGKDKNVNRSVVEYVGTEAAGYISRKLETASHDRQMDLVESYIRGTYEWAQEKENHAIFWLYYYYLCAVDKKLGEINRAILANAKQRITRLIFENIGRKKMPPMAGVENLASEIHQTLMGGVITATIEGNPAAYTRHCSLTIKIAHDLIQIHAARESPVEQNVAGKSSTHGDS